MLPDPVRLLESAARDIGDVARDVTRDLGDVARDVGDVAAVIGRRTGLLAEPPPPPPPPTGARAVAVRAQAVAAPAARVVLSSATAVAVPAARVVTGPATAVAGPPARVVLQPAARALVTRFPAPSKSDAARSASTRMARGGGGLVMPEQLAHRFGLPAGNYALATPGIGPMIGLRDFAVGFLVITFIDDPLKLRAAVTLATAVDVFDAAVMSAPMIARRVGGRVAMRGGALALRAADMWHRSLRWE
jgi:hypothetical protein